MKLQGGAGLARRLKAMSGSMHGYPRDWSDGYVQAARPQIPVKTGATRRSVHVARANDHHGEVTGSSVAGMIDSGTKSHGIEPASAGVLRFRGSAGRTVFARKVDHPGTRAHPFIERAAEEATRRNPMDDRVVGAWNRAD